MRNALGALGLIAVFATTTIAAPAAGARPLNVLFIAADDLRTELGCYGSKEVLSPNLDRLAAQGVLFERAYTQYASCCPSRSSLLTGLRPDSTGVYGNNQHFREKVPDAVTLPQRFKESGYVTRGFGKIFHGSFETAYVGRKYHDPRSWTEPTWCGSPQYYFSPEGIAAAREVYAKKTGKSGAALEGWKEDFTQAWSAEAPDVADSVLYDGQSTDRAIATLRALKDQPFFLAVGYLKPHLPFVAPKKYWDLYDRAKLKLPAYPKKPDGTPAVAWHNWNEMRGQYSDVPKTGPLTEAKLRELRHGYFACVSYVDAMIGRLLGELDRLGLRERTIVVFWSDHGYHLGEQDHWGKDTPFELDARVPLIVSAPGKGVKGARTAALVELVDLYPSLCELAGLPAPATLEGTSFVPLLDRPDRPWKSAVFSQTVRRTGGIMGRSMRTDRHRFTVWTDPKAPAPPLAVELYDARPGAIETANIAARPENAALVRELTAQLAAGWQAARPPGR